MPDTYKKRIPAPILDEVDAMLTKISEADPGFRPREQQYRMILALTAGFLEQNLGVIEGPTGVGKSLAYLIAGSVVAKHLNKKLVIATATVALQEQLLRELPEFVTRVGDKDLQYGIAKGRGRYACMARLSRVGTGEGSEAVLLNHHGLGRQETEVLEKMSLAMREGWDGDRDTWQGPLDDATWQAATTDRHGCHKRRCMFIGSCPYYTARNRLRETRIIVANQDILLSDVGLGGGYLLPKPEDCIYVIDEAHHLPHKAVKHFSERTQLLAIERWMERLPKITAALTRILKDPEIAVLARQASDRAHRLHRTIMDFIAGLSNYSPIQIANGAGGDADQSHYRFPHGELPEVFAGYARTVRAETEGLAGVLRDMRAKTEQAIEGGDVVALKAEPWQSALGGIYGRLEKSIRCWNLLLEESDEATQPVAKWVSVKEYHGKLDYVIEAARASPASVLQELLWPRAHAAVVTSATLTVGGEFHHYAASTGLEGFPRTEYLRLASPFDYPNRAVLHVPRMRTIPGKDNAHTEELVELLPQHIGEQEAALVLFCSRNQMQEVLRGLPAAFLEKCLAQNSKSRRELLEEHGRRVREGRGSVIFGLQSFAEGLDLPGELCNHVIITKIPFSPPDNPVEQAQAEWITARGGNAFVEMMVSQACIRLVQGVGRLLRRENDHGKVTILDRRIVERNYGKLLMRSLPPMRMEVEHVRAMNVA